MKLLPLIVLSVLVVVSIFPQSRIFAETDESTTEINEVTENLKNRLKETINAVETTNDTGVTPKAYVGSVRDIVQETIVIDDKSGKKNIIINADAEIIRSPGNADIKIENVGIDDSIIAIGYPLSGTDELDGRRIIVSAEPFSPPEKMTGIGTIIKINKSSLVIENIEGQEPITLLVNTKTNYKTISESLELEELNVSDKIIYSALIDEKDSEKITATIIMQIDANEPPVSPQPSPKVSPKPSSSLRPSPRPSPSI